MLFLFQNKRVLGLVHLCTSSPSLWPVIDLKFSLSTMEEREFILFLEVQLNILFTVCIKRKKLLFFVAVVKCVEVSWRQNAPYDLQCGEVICKDR
jgi:hypothetical protein